MALAKGKHRFKVVFADVRCRPVRRDMMWGFPHPDFTWKGDSPELLLSGPGLPRQPVPDSMLANAKE